MSAPTRLIILLLFVFSCQNNKGRPISRPLDSIARVNLLKLRANSAYERNDYPKAIKYFDSLIAVDSMCGEYYFKRGFSYDMIYQRPEVHEAIKDYLKSIQLGYKKSQSYYSLGLSYFLVDDSTALSYFQKSLSLNPNDADAANLVEQCKLRLKPRLR
jgi:tetratricopeptide (TPR) repeat protein